MVFALYQVLTAKPSTVSTFHQSSAKTSGLERHRQRILHIQRMSDILHHSAHAASIHPGGDKRSCDGGNRSMARPPTRIQMFETTNKAHERGQACLWGRNNGTADCQTYAASAVRPL
ncbi:hypothetical protein NDU88_000713 [Pleurodeles waltl]|uniref:Uncharacterized protein n=1 Tax=Pleurodeles waltl TaxID=8319 RepID=A0AAV7L7C4_PLEWA|nr:hypothetical protein NDU88_000713 [Pleurodeles waltl]